MTFPQLYDLFASLPSGGSINDDTRLQKGFMYALINNCKAAAQRQVYKATKRTHPDWFIQYYPEYDSTWQTSPCDKVFYCPAFVSLDEARDGIGYVGSVETNFSMIVVKDHQTYSAMLQHQDMKPRANEAYVLFLPNGLTKIYGSFVRQPVFDIIPADPRDIPTYNIETDRYPVDEGLIEVMKKIAMGTDMMIITKSAINALNGQQPIVNQR